MTAIIDYGAGNLPSVEKAVKYLGFSCEITSDPDVLAKADSLILPGVGAFPAAVRCLEKSGLIPVIKRETQKKPLLGICLGMQLLFEKSFEFGETPGLGLIPGEIRLITPDGLKIPHMGWNSLEITEASPLYEGLSGAPFVYFVHSYAAVCDRRYVSAFTDYGGKITASAQNGNVFGTQFHPEKSGEAGLAILRNFLMRGERI